MQGYPNAIHHQPSSVYTSIDPHLRPSSPPNLRPDAHAPAPVGDSSLGQNAYISNSAGVATQCEPRDLIRFVQASPVPLLHIGDTGSLVQDLITVCDLISRFDSPVSNHFAKSCVCSTKYWLLWCPRVAEHYNSAILYSSWVINYPCICEWKFPMAQLPRWCPKAASHLLDRVSHYLLTYTTDIG